MSTCTIGLFDSGIGGLSVARHVKRLLPTNPLIYLSDSQFAPYGDKMPMQVRRRCEAIVEYLLAQGANVIVVACNTATVHHIQALREKYQVPFVGVEPGIKPAVQSSRSKRIGVMVTRQTAKSPNLAAHIAQFSTQADIKVVACPGLAEAVERLDLSPGLLLRTFISELDGQGIDQLVLGCTHYHFLTESIRTLVGSQVNLVDTGEAVAKQVSRVLADLEPVAQVSNWQASDEGGEDRFVTTGDLARFNRQLTSLWPFGKVDGQQVAINPLKKIG